MHFIHSYSKSHLGISLWLLTLTLMSFFIIPNCYRNKQKYYKIPGTPIISWAIKAGYIEEKDTENIKKGINAYYHAGGEFQSQQIKKRFF